MQTDFKRVNLFDFERKAGEHLPEAVFGYYVGGADDEITLNENRTAYARIQLLPRVLVDVSQRSSQTTLLGQEIGFPVVVAPMAMAKMAHPEGEAAIAAAAGALNIPMALSTMSNTSLEAVSQAATGPLWFQLYVYKDRAITRRLIARAEAAGYQAVVLTVDAPILGKRERDEYNNFNMPPGLVLENLTEFTLQQPTGQQAGSALVSYAAAELDSSLSWADLDWLCSITRLPVLVKGVLRPDDALRAQEHGAAGVVISNHGGRQLDTTPATIDLLPEIAAAVSIPLLIDGGIRRGTDILKALALGAQAVMIGRPVLWGLALEGEAGVRQVLHLLHTEFDIALGLCGCPSVRAITRDLVRLPGDA